MTVIIYSFNLNISPKTSHGVLECDIVTELHAYDFVIKKGCYLCRTLYLKNKERIIHQIPNPSIRNHLL